MAAQTGGISWRRAPKSHAWRAALCRISRQRKPAKTAQQPAAIAATAARYRVNGADGKRIAATPRYQLAQTWRVNVARCESEHPGGEKSQQRLEKKKTATPRAALQSA